MRHDPRLEVGERVGDAFEVRGVVPRPDGAIVYDARDVLLERSVVIKLAPDAPTLRREALALAAVRHANLPAVYGVGTHRNLPYLVLEQVEGITLAQLIDEQRRADTWLRAADALQVLAGLADVIAAVHGCGRAHGGVSASRVVLTPTERVVLLDLGTMDLPADYAQARDVHAFGSLAFELLTGAAPRGERDDVAATRQDVPLPVADVVQACIAGDPRKRPTMDVVAWALRGRSRRRTGRREAVAAA